MIVIKEEALALAIPTRVRLTRTTLNLAEVPVNFRRYTHDNIVSYITTYVEKQWESCFSEHNKYDFTTTISREIIFRLNLSTPRLNDPLIKTYFFINNQDLFIEFLVDTTNFKYWGNPPSYATRFIAHNKAFSEFIEESFMCALEPRSSLLYTYFSEQSFILQAYPHAIRFTYLNLTEFLTFTPISNAILNSIISLINTYDFTNVSYVMHRTAIETMCFIIGDIFGVSFFQFLVPDLYYATFINERERRRNVSVVRFFSFLLLKYNIIDILINFSSSDTPHRYLEHILKSKNAGGIIMRAYDLNNLSNFVLYMSKNSWFVKIHELIQPFLDFLRTLMPNSFSIHSFYHIKPRIYLDLVDFELFEIKEHKERTHAITTCVEVILTNLEDYTTTRYDFKTDSYIQFKQHIDTTVQNARFFFPIKQYQQDRYDLFKNIENTFPGSLSFLLSGGESNPGPVFSRLLPDFKRILVQHIRNWVLNQYKDVIRPTVDIAVFSLHIVRIFTSVVDLFNSLIFNRGGIGFDLVARVSNLILNCHESWRLFGFEVARRTTAEAGAIETMLASVLISTTVPRYMKNILNDMPRLTSFKLLDDTSIIFDFLAYILSIPRRVLESIGGKPDKEGMYQDMYLLLCRLEDSMPFSLISNVKHEMHALCEEHKNNASIMSDVEYGKKIEALNTRRLKIEDDYLLDKRELPKYYINIKNQFDNFIKIYYNYKGTSRVEPVCVVFCGPPKTGKSVLTTQLVEIYKQSQRTVFTDTLPASLEAKRFYDTYNDEDVYTIDDMGAKAKSQWSEIVNMVSTSRYPLDAAAISNKSMKSFNSPLMLLTTNHIPTEFGPKDGVADYDAFCRRLIRFDTTELTFNGKFGGSIDIQLYDSSPGIRAWRMQSKIVADDDFYANIITYIHGKQLEKIRLFETNKSNVKGIFAPQLPKVRAQAFEDIRAIIFDRIREMPMFDTILASSIDTYDTIMECAEKFMEREKSTKEYMIFGALAVAAIGLGLYMVFKKKEDNLELDLVKGDKPIFRTAYKRGQKDLRFVRPEGFVSLAGEPLMPLPPLAKYVRNTLEIHISGVDLKGKDFSSKVRGLFSGHMLLTVAHPFATLDLEKPFFLTAIEGKTVIYDTIEVKQVKISLENDWVMLELPISLPMYYRKVVTVIKPRSTNLVLVTGNGSAIRLAEDYQQIDFLAAYEYRQYKGGLVPGDITYDIHGEGMCGSILASEDGALLGMHVAMTEDTDGIEKGVTKLWPSSDLKLIKEIFEQDYAPIIIEKMSTGDERSGVIRERTPYIHSGEKTSYVKSPIYGIFPSWRKPALELGSEHKDFAPVIDNMMKLTPVANIKGIDFCSQVLKADLASDEIFEPLGEVELVNGNLNLSKIDPRTSCGTAYAGRKKDYLDYDTGKVLDSGKIIVKEITDKIVIDKYDFSDFATLTLKDELKDVENLDDPEHSMPKKVRVFTNYHLVSTLLFRYFFGNFMSFVFKKREINGVMVGINPMSEQWTRLHNKISTLNGTVFDGDYSNFDRNMHPMFQRTLNRWLKGRVKIDENHFNKTFSTKYSKNQIEKILDQILECIISTPIRGQDKSFITTHGLPSGLVLTSIYNSYINKMYMAYCYFMTVPREYQTPSKFNENTVFAFYGDDVLGNISNQIRPHFNPMTMHKILESLNLGFTPTQKNTQWTQDNMFRQITETTFLKRKFYYHPLLKTITAPLSTISMEGTLNYISDKNRAIDLIVDKLHGFQREAFLHPPHVYEKYMNHIDNYITHNNKHFLNYTPLSKQTLIDIYATDKYTEYMDL